MIHQHAHTLAVAKLYISCGIFPPFLTPHSHRHVGDKGCSSYTSYTGWESNFGIQHHHKLHTRHCCRPPFQQFCQYRGPAQIHQSYNLNVPFFQLPGPGWRGSRPVCAQPRVGPHSLPAVEAQAGRQGSGRQGKGHGGHQ